MKCLAVFLVLIGFSLALPVEKQNAEAEKINQDALDQLLSMLDSKTAATTAQDTELAKTQSFKSVVTALLPFVVETIVDAVGGEQAKEQSSLDDLDQLLSMLNSKTAATTAQDTELAKTQGIGAILIALISLAAASTNLAAGLTDDGQAKEQSSLDDLDELLSRDLVRPELSLERIQELLSNLGPIQQDQAKARTQRIRIPGFIRDIGSRVKDIAVPIAGDLLREGLQRGGGALLDKVFGDGQATAQQQMTPESFFRLCCQIAMSLSEGEEVSMMELCRRCCEVAEGLLDAGKGMTSDQFYKFCCSVAKEMMGQDTPPVAVDGAKAQGLRSKIFRALKFTPPRMGPRRG